MNIKIISYRLSRFCKINIYSTSYSITRSSNNKIISSNITNNHR